MKNDLIQKLKFGGHKMSYDFNLEKTDFSLENNDQFTKDRAIPNFLEALSQI
jgi:hypothetical protein